MRFKFYEELRDYWKKSSYKERAAAVALTLIMGGLTGYYVYNKINDIIHPKKIEGIYMGKSNLEKKIENK